MMWRFEPLPEHSVPLIAEHHMGLVVLATLLAILAASTLLPVLERYRRAESMRSGWGWVLAGALAMGFGVWAMHFTAMLAHRLPVPVSYSPAITLLSMIPIVLGSSGTLLCARMNLPRYQRLWLAALSLGAGVGAMHYVGMEALIAPVAMHYQPGLFILSVLIAVAMAWLGLASNLWLLRRTRRWLAYLVGAAILGLAVTAMHYVAMAATVFVPGERAVVSGLTMDFQVLSVLVSVAVTFIAALLFLAVLLDRRFSLISASLSDSEKRFELLAETSESGIFTCDQSFDYINPAMSAITGYGEGELYQMPVADLFGFDPLVEFRGRALDEHLYREAFVTTKQGDHRWLYVTLGRLHGDAASAYLGSAFDITERKQMEQELRYLAFNDPLTDLPNRKFFMNRLSALTSEWKDRRPSPGEPSAPFAVMFIDVNRFKLINDNFGVSKGDQLLKVIARRIRSALPRSGLVSRVGGDEFAVLFEGASQVQLIEREAERLHRAFDQAFRLGEQEFFLSLSVGIALFDPRYEDAEALYRDATLAKERAKHSGQAESCVFDGAMHQSAQSRLKLERDLRQALKDEAFELFYQPIVGLPNGGLTGFEALIRWRKPDGSLIPPGEFIAVAEETGLINPLGDWVLREACRQIGQWRENQGEERTFYVSVNLSSIQFFQADLIATVRAAMNDHGVQPGQLKLELTEGILVDDNPQIVERMRQLLSMGCGIMVDDFGTGYSSLSYLQRFPLEVLKIDQSFTAKLDENTGLHLVRAIISMAHALELGVIAEGIENEGVARALAELGCELGQGYYFDRPLSVEQAGRCFESTREGAGLLQNGHH